MQMLEDKKNQITIHNLQQEPKTHRKQLNVKLNKLYVSKKKATRGNFSRNTFCWKHPVSLGTSFKYMQLKSNIDVFWKFSKKCLV